MSHIGTDGTHTSDPLSLKVVHDDPFRGLSPAVKWRSLKWPRRGPQMAAGARIAPLEVM